MSRDYTRRREDTHHHPHYNNNQSVQSPSNGNMEHSLNGSRIEYALIADGTFVVAEYSATHSTQGYLLRTSDGPDLHELSRSILPRVQSSTKTSAADVYQHFLLGSYIYSYAVGFGLIFLCVSQQSTGHKLPVQFLSELQRRYGQTLLTNRDGVRQGAHTAHQCTLLLKTVVDRCDSGGDVALSVNDPVTHRGRDLERGLERTADAMKKNIGLVMNRHEQIDSLLNRAAVLNTEMSSLHATSRTLKNKMWWKSQKSFFAVCLVLGIVLVTFCITAKGSVASYNILR
eukprot:Lankesteria_metandrocarpae@DN3971_c1_g1_i1.p1